MNDIDSLLIERNKGCYYFKPKDDIKIIDKKICEFLINKLEKNNLDLGRICIHDVDKDIIQAMLIALNSRFLVKNHLHNTPEIIQVLRGSLEIKTYNKNKLIDTIILKENENFICRLSNKVVHSVKSRNGWCVFFEVASGPFNNKKTIYV